MTDAQKKAVTEWMKRHYHTIEINAVDYNFPGRCSCGQGALYPAELDEHIRKSNPSFTTAQDLVDCFDRLVELEKWKDFEVFAFNKYHHLARMEQLSFTQWLLSKLPDGTYRLCGLIAEWLEKGEQ